ncbi:MAG TPA: PAS domain S-box protein [Candidatus Kapabacteria bacterium]|nr:PAS domain S-box protein [Candidatus Kapabacteria bacterium]
MKLQQENGIFIGFGLALLIFAIVGSFAFLSLRNVEDTIGWVVHTHRVIEKLDDILSLAQDAETGTRGYTITGDTTYLDPYNNASQTLSQKIHDLRAFMSDNTSQLKNIDTLQSLADEKLSILKNAIEKRTMEGFDSVATMTKTGKGNTLMQEIRDLIARMQSQEEALLVIRNDTVESHVLRTHVIVITGMLLGFGLIIAALLILRSDMQKRNAAEIALQQSEERYREIINNADDIIYRTDADAKIILCNPVATRVTKYSESELIGKHYLELVHPDARKETQNFYMSQRQEKVPNTYYEFPILTKEGEKRWIGQNLQIIMHDGTLAGFQAVARDITSIKRAEQALHESEARFRGIFEHTPIGMALISLDGKFLQVNAALEDMLGYSAEELCALPSIGAITHPDDVKVSFRVMSEIQKKKINTASFEKRYIHKQGYVVWVAVNSALITDAAKNPLYLIGQIQDITYRKRAQQEIQELNKQLAQKIDQLEVANKDLEAFSYSVSHDLRSPLQSVQGFTFLLKETAEAKLDDQEKEFLANVETSGKRMQEIIEDLLTLAHTTQNEFAPEDVDLSAIARTIAESLRAATPERNVTFVIQDNITVRGDKRLLRVLMENLIGNAWKYSSKHSAAKIEFGEECKNGDSQTIFVRDDGAGFDMKYAETMFDPFKRLHTAKDFPGTGVGLATVKRIVQRHDGTIRAEGAVEKGATFYITFPKPVERVESAFVI